MMLNEDYRDMLRALSDEKVKYVLVGAYALAAHGYLRATVDIDGIEVRVPSLADLIRNKRTSGRTKDIADAEALEEIQKSCE